MASALKFKLLNGSVCLKTVMCHVCLWEGCVVTSSVRGYSCRPLVHRKYSLVLSELYRSPVMGTSTISVEKSTNTSVVFALVSCTSALETDYSTALFSKKREYLFLLIPPLGSPSFPVSSQRVGKLFREPPSLFLSPLPPFPFPPVSKPQRGLPEPRPVCDQCSVR